MKAFLSPSENGWPLKAGDNYIEGWINSGKTYLILPFWWFKPTTLPENSNEPFWLYFYSSAKRSTDESFAESVSLRARVVAFEYEPSETWLNAGYRHDDPHDPAKVYFCCDLIQTIEPLDKEAIQQCIHNIRGTELLQSIRNSIAEITITCKVTVKHSIFGGSLDFSETPCRTPHRLPV